MEPNVILDSARDVQSDAAQLAYRLGNHAGGVSVDELRTVVGLIRDLAQTVAELALRVGNPQAAT